LRLLDKIKTEIIDPENETDSARLGLANAKSGAQATNRNPQQQFAQIRQNPEETRTQMQKWIFH
jgi:hypothetical protein